MLKRRKNSKIKKNYIFKNLFHKKIKWRYYIIGRLFMYLSSKVIKKKYIIKKKYKKKII